MRLPSPWRAAREWLADMLYVRRRGGYRNMLLDTLKDIEWAPADADVFDANPEWRECPSCHEPKHRGHMPECALDAAMQQAGRPYVRNL